VNWDAVVAIRVAVEVPCELGGGIRDEATIRELLDLGFDRLVVGTRAIKEPMWFQEVCRQYPGKLALGVDARGGRVATDGWLETSNMAATDLVQQFAMDPIAAVIYTDIARDGMLSGPNWEALEEMNAATELPVIASGGITTCDDVRRLAQIGVAGCILGRSLYEGQLTLADALAAAMVSGEW
jgi:phosphoribosylformimino-5-aminoimidazole carboxamide ribotide isomerase